MVSAVEEFTYGLLTDVFNAADTAPLAVEAILSAGSFDPGPKVGRIDMPEQWTREKIAEKATAIDSDKGPAGDFDD
jgi:hypothetical protein